MNNNKKQKVICIGWHKTGTTTIGDALLKLGYYVNGARLDLAEPLYKGDFDYIIDVAKKFEALQDIPWASLYKELDEAFPNSKFILTVRDEKEWLNSAKKHFKDKDIRLHEWLYGVGILEGNEDLYLERYRKHYDDIKKYFKDRPEDIIIMDFKKGDGWDKLCTFLDLPIPKKPFPHSNKGKHNYTAKDKLIYQLRNLIPKWIREWRILILIKLGFPDKRDRFNNKRYNKPILEKNKRNSKQSL